VLLLESSDTLKKAQIFSQEQESSAWNLERERSSNFGSQGVFQFFEWPTAQGVGEGYS
jgi:hypothetical protein